MKSWLFKPLEELINGLKQKKISSVELTQAYITQTKATEGAIQAFLSFDEQKTLAEAAASDKRRAEDKCLSELDGIPIGLKDIFAEKGQPLTCASRMLENFVSPYDSTVVQKL